MSANDEPRGSAREQFPSPEWTMKVEATPAPDGHNQYHADVFRAADFVCRVALAGRFDDQAAAEAALVVRVRQWLIGYEQRPRAADSGFQIL